jgi:hypothetical protein
LVTVSRIDSLATKADLKTQLEKMRSEIRDTGESLFPCERLHLLFPETLASGHWDAISKMAMTEGWSFTFLPNGSVSFARL